MQSHKDVRSADWHAHHQSSKTLLGSPSSTFDRTPFPFPRLKARSPILKALISRLLPLPEAAEADRRESLLALCSLFRAALVIVVVFPGMVATLRPSGFLLL
jgi:hypothetical protein